MSTLASQINRQYVLDMLADGERLSDLSKSLGVPESELSAVLAEADATAEAVEASLQDDPASQEALYEQIRSYHKKLNPATNKPFSQAAVAKLFGKSTAFVGKVWRTPPGEAHVAAYMPDAAAWRVRTLYRILQGRYSASELARLEGVSRVQITMFIAWLRKVAMFTVCSTDAGKNSVFYSPEYEYKGEALNPIAAVGVQAEPVPPPVDAGEDLPPVHGAKPPKAPVDHWRTVGPEKAQAILELAGTMPMPAVAAAFGVNIATVCYIWQGKRRKTLVPTNPTAVKFLETYRAQPESTPEETTEE